MHFLNSFFDHLRYFTAAARRRGAAGQFHLGSMDAVVTRDDRTIEFRAQYLTRRDDGSLTYSMNFDEDAPGFVGWLPYFNKRWPEATDKLAFKQRIAQAGLPTPLWSVKTVSTELGDYVIKRIKGSFGEGMRGPFDGHTAAAAVLGQDEFAERFFLGQVGKAWYWNERVVAIELRDPPTIVGDGAATLAELVRRRRHSANVSNETDFFRYRGLRWTDVPSRDASVVVDFRYGSDCYPFTHTSLNRYEELKDGAIVGRLNQWGSLFWSFVPATLRSQTLYSVDFVIARDGGIRLLEMNCNPTVPPEAYEVIFTALFGEPGAEVNAPGNAIARPDAPPVPPRPSALPPPSPVLASTVPMRPGALTGSNGAATPNA